MVTSRDFYTLPDGRVVTAFRITNRFGEYVDILTYGATIRSLCVLDRDGKLGDVVLGTTEGEDPTTTLYTGAAIGRCGNRIAYATYTIDGKTYHLTPTEGPHHLHGAKGGFAYQFFRGEPNGENSVTLYHKDTGIDGWECDVDVAITYTFDDDHALTIDYALTTHGSTVLSPTNHAYFNLNQPKDILDTELKLFTDKYTPKSELRMPDGRVASVVGTPLDFSEARTFGAAMQANNGFFPDYQDAFDDFYVVPGEGVRQAAEAYCPENGRVMRVFTDAESVVLYTPLKTEPVINKGQSLKGLFAFCLETQYVPNAVNCPEYRSPVFRAGETMKSRTVYAFDVK